jgi:hypothetical protein
MSGFLKCHVAQIYFAFSNIEGRSLGKLNDF